MNILMYHFMKLETGSYKYDIYKYNQNIINIKILQI